MDIESEPKTNTNNPPIMMLSLLNEDGERAFVHCAMEQITDVVGAGDWWQINTGTLVPRTRPWGPLFGHFGRVSNLNLQEPR